MKINLKFLVLFLLRTLTKIKVILFHDESVKVSLLTIKSKTSLVELVWNLNPLKKNFPTFFPECFRKLCLFNIECDIYF